MCVFWTVCCQWINDFTTIQSTVCETVWQLDYTDGDGSGVPGIWNFLPPHYLDQVWCTLERGLCQLSATSEVCSLMCECGEGEGGRRWLGGEGGNTFYYCFGECLLPRVPIRMLVLVWVLSWLVQQFWKILVGQSRIKLVNYTIRYSDI